ncbi:HPr(Ser) kinase/phosphatase [Peptoniphilus catoniae]|uniref:HPr(Ser) kinase/phosphatase n=1 Tax=Peptoniphilus catoniae TaxID=1660341 RepID=UPI0010FE8DE0|nr:HPr(Ser) kinase/phosphatase [Peptoniphilus catoniae]
MHDSIKLKKIVESLKLETVYLSSDYEDVRIISSNLNKPGLQMVGHHLELASNKILIIDQQEWYFINEKKSEDRFKIMELFSSYKIPAIIFISDNYIFEEVIEYAKKKNVSVFRTRENFFNFSTKFKNYFEYELAPVIRVHGVLLDIYGVGVLITGDSGIGKSETALDLISKGSKLISDDTVIVKKFGDSLIGTSPDLTRYFMEIRGVGIIDVQSMFGVGYVMESKEIEMIAHLEKWEDHKEYERLGIDRHYEEILGKKIVKYTLPVKPGRQNALVVEVATKSYKQNEIGYNAALELNRKILNNKGNHE